MKNTSSIICILLFISCSNKLTLNNSQLIIQIEIFYVPWDYRTEGKLTESELKNLSDQSISHFCTSDKSVIYTLLTALSESNLRLFKELKEIEPYMIIEIHFKRGETKKVILNRSQLLKIDKNIYFKNIQLEQWILNNVPSASFPKGIRNC